ncbi:peptidase [Actinorhabdospora filicis]|uniref:Peptidase n=1 Tax=Actinorhabdospora filicis TaxID=1785913 RepID=A0A9W6W1Y2_9ACTN|nr:S8 family serine peptidase [Actinorhabdospora filicis]GLZ76402.1 peptidase [Actinorhabdospora filicis]
MPPNKRRILLPVIAASALALGLAPVPAAAGEPLSPTTVPSPAGVTDARVTLITGDVVTVHALGDGTSSLAVERPEGATGAVYTQTYGGSTYVIPAEAQPLIAAATVDRDLFNIDRLIEYGYTDGDIPVIVQYGSAPRTLSALAGTEGGRALPSINAVATTVDGDAPGALWDAIAAPKARGLAPTRVHLDGKVKADLTESVPQIGAPAAWRAGFDGTGVTVAVLDTGVDAAHPDLSGRVGATKDFTGSRYGVEDHNGHGTHVASTIAGTGAGDGAHKGVAPGASVIVGKVLGDDGYGQDSWIIGAMEWAVAQGADVVNLSLGGQTPDDGNDPMSLAVNRLSAESDTLFVIAAGNAGCVGCISSPGSAAGALTVSAVDKADQIAYFTSQGPLYGSYALKPDLAGPGVDIEAARSQWAPGSGLYQSMSGTSMATPHVVGAAAILKQRHPGWDGERVKDALVSTSKQLDYTPYEIGTGRVDVAAAIDAEVTSSGSVDFGFFDWPHDDGPVTRAVTYTNGGTAEVTLSLALAAKDETGAAVPAGALALSAESVTVPAGGSVSVDVTAAPALFPLGHTYGGKLTASANGVAVASTSLGLVKEEERYGLTVKVIGRDGKPAAGYFALQGDTMYEPEPVAVDGETELRLKPGTYAITMFLEQPGADGGARGSLALLIAPEVKPGADAVVTLDARTAVKSESRAPERTVDRQRHVFTHRKITEDSVLDNGAILPLYVEDVYVTPTKPVTVGEFEFYARWRKGISPLTLSVLGCGKIDPLPQAGTPSPDFDALLKATVYAGAGAASDYAGLRAKGAVAVVTRSDEVSPEERAAAAKAAGAVLLIVVNDGPGVLSEYYPGAALPVASLKADQGRGLVGLAKWGVPVTVASTVYSPVTYDLLDVHPGAVPANLTFVPARRDLARVDAKYHGKTPGEGGEFRFDLRPWSDHAIGFLERLSVPAERTEWVSAPEGSRFHEDVYSPGMDWESRGGLDVYRPGSRQVKDWFAPIVRPRLGLGAWQPVRYPGTWTTINITPWTDSGAGHAGFLGEETLDTRLYQGETLLKKGSSQALYLDLPEERKDYRLVMDASRPEAWEYSTRTHTEWSFSSAAPTTDGLEAIALLQLDYAVATDLGGDVKAGSKVTVGLSASHMPGVVGAGKVTGATFQFSYDDGVTWQQATLVSDGKGGWKTTLSLPKDAAKYVSVRATATDDAGGAISQEVIRAFGLK